jgi:hypothetical protein
MTLIFTRSGKGSQPFLSQACNYDVCLQLIDLVFVLGLVAVYFVETEGPLLCLQDPTSGHCPEPY